ncbi:conserved protein, unknown function [Plasmodium sp. gorilla clade G2]|uniref:conserved protein, unknown function n=1 Tax=Plasmodium sp. gorilla clade G2 TaxID=880535 RepID=UPI000D20A180|nr:conserved protein, unknown function [Plasmodium sp. gorilla clade G2]SOV18746.1 conserved protein, unknown function [Plasmodium sp. gorilla clade G2]
MQGDKTKKGKNFKIPYSSKYKNEKTWEDNIRNRKKKKNPKRNEKNNLMHDRNIHKYIYIDYIELSKKYTFLKLFLQKNEKSTNSYYNFEQSIAVYFLSKSILKEYYDLNFYMPYIKNDEIQNKIILDNNIFNTNKFIYTINEFKDINSLKNIILLSYENYNTFLLNLKNDINTNLSCHEYDESTITYNNNSNNNSNIINEQTDDIYNKYTFQCNKKNENTILQNDQVGKFLCPCVPGRVNYIHILADLTDINELKNFKNNDKYISTTNINENINNTNKIQNNMLLLYGNIIKVLDIGVGANCIYPLLGNNIYKWSFLGTDINIDSLKYSFINILINNKENDIHLKYQTNKRYIFQNVINNSDLFFFSMCNPPYYTFIEEVNKNPYRMLEANIDEVVYYLGDEKGGTINNNNNNNSNNNNNDNNSDIDYMRGANIHINITHTDDIQTHNINLDRIISSELGPINTGNQKEQKIEKEEEYNITKSQKENSKHCCNNKKVGDNINDGNITSLKISINEGEEHNVNNTHFINTSQNYNNKGGEYKFIMNMLEESISYFFNVIWFTTLVSKFKNVKLIKKEIINSMRLYHEYKKNQVYFLNSIINENLYFNQTFVFKNIQKKIPPVSIAQYRIFESYSGNITRWIICWSYYNPEQIDAMKKLYYEKSK